MREQPYRIAADLDFSAEAVRVTYLEPWRLLRWSGHRRVRRAFVIRPRLYRELFADQIAFEAIAARYAEDATGQFVARIMLIAGPHAAFLPPKAQEEIDATYRRVNRLPELGSGSSRNNGESEVVSFDRILRRLERAPFNLTREAVMELTAAQIEERLSEWGDEKLNDWKLDHPDLAS